MAKEAVKKESVKKGDAPQKKSLWKRIKEIFRPDGVTWLPWADTKKQFVAVVCIVAIAGVLLLGFDALMSLFLKVVL